MAYELVGKSPKSSIGIAVRFNVLKWVHIVRFLKWLGFDIDERRAVIISNFSMDESMSIQLEKALLCLDGQQLNTGLDETSPFPELDKGCVATYDDIVLFCKFLRASGGFAVR